MTIQLDFAYQYSARERLQFVGDSLVMDNMVSISLNACKFVVPLS